MNAKDFLGLLSKEFYKEYLEAKKKDVVMFEKLYDNGFIYVRDEKDAHYIIMAFTSDFNRDVLYDIDWFFEFGKNIQFVSNVDPEIVKGFIDEMKQKITSK